MCSAPTIGVRDDPGRLVIVLLYHAAAGAAAKFALLDHVRQQAEEARALDRLREFALLLRRNRGDAARHDLAALGDVTLQELHVLVVDLRGVGAREGQVLRRRKKGRRAPPCAMTNAMVYSSPPRCVLAAARAAAVDAVAVLATPRRRAPRGRRGRDRICASSPTDLLRAPRRGW